MGTPSYLVEVKKACNARTVLLSVLGIYGYGGVWGVMA